MPSTASSAAPASGSDQVEKKHDDQRHPDFPDGYLDHFQIVHAGGDQADGDPTFGEDAIWSHRWYAFVTDACQASYVRGQAAQPSFDDSKKFWFAEAPAVGVKLPAAGVKIKVVSEKGTSMKVDIS